jgi:hypothetical protein
MFAHGGDDVLDVRVDGSCRAELSRDPPAALHWIDGDDGRDAERARRHDCRKTHGAGSENDQRRVLVELEHVHDRTRAGLNTAAERRRHAQVGTATDDDHVVLIRKSMRSEARLSEEGCVDRSAARVQSRRTIRAGAARIEHREVPAVVRIAGGALGTRAAAPVAHDDTVAAPDPLDVGADRLDHAGTLVPEHGRIAPARDPRPDLLHAHVGVTDSAGDQPDQDLVLPRLVELDLLEGGRAPRGMREHGPDDHRRLRETR